MTAYRRLRLPGATYFFTLCLEEPARGLLIDDEEEKKTEGEES